jgi:hypothetical protein
MRLKLKASHCIGLPIGSLAYTANSQDPAQHDSVNLGALLQEPSEGPG